jgi:hypothetical protein
MYLFCLCQNLDRASRRRELMTINMNRILIIENLKSEYIFFMKIISIHESTYEEFNLCFYFFRDRSK